MVKKEHIIFFLFFLLGFVYPRKIDAAGPTAVSTFHSIGIYWSPTDMAEDNVCQVRYRQLGEDVWRNGLDLWYDYRSDTNHTKEYRGSLVHLNPGTTYEVELKLQRTGTTTTFTTSTWQETDSWPIAQTIDVNNRSTTLTINQSGTPDGYILYDGYGTTVIDGQNNINRCITIDASYIILRGITCINPAEHGIVLNDGVHDVLIENNDISGWGKIADQDWEGDVDDTWGDNQDGAIRNEWSSTNIERIVIQRNKFHHPRSDTNNWGENRPEEGVSNSYHPRGPQVIVLFSTKGNHVFRYNEVYSDSDHYYNDIFGGGSNHSYKGFPGQDSDIYGNYLINCWDDGIEAEGGNRNVRIWGNYINNCYQMIATYVTSLGPLYIWRNIANISKRDDSGGGGGFIKDGSDPDERVDYGWGKKYIFHNTILQPQGCDAGIYNWDLFNIYSRNNILQVRNISNLSIGNGNKDVCSDGQYDPDQCGNDFNYDLYNGVIQIPSGQEANGINSVPIYDPSFNFNVSLKQGIFVLDPSSPGYNDGEIIPNFNDGYTGTTPDMGAHEANTLPMEFGVNAYLNPQPSSSPVAQPSPSPSTQPSDYQYTVLKAVSPPVIDGDLSEYTRVGEIIMTSSTGLEGKYKFLWDDTALYLGASVNDPTLYASTTERDGSIWTDDSLELKLDTLFNHGDTLLADDYLIYLNLLEIFYDRQNNDSSWNGSYEVEIILNGTPNDSGLDDGYTIELKIPWSILELTAPLDNTTWGMDLALNDKYSPASTDFIQTTWANTNGGSFIDPDGWGELIFSSQQAPSCPADLTGDSLVNQHDLRQILLGFFNTCPDCQGDLNKDNFLNSLDLGFVIKEWGSCE